MLRQSSYIFVAKIIGYGIRILLPAFLVRVLTKAEFGSYNQFFLVELMFQTVFQMGTNQSQFYFVPNDPKNAGGIFLNSIVINTGLYVTAYSLIATFRAPLAGFLNMPVLLEMFWFLASYSFLLMLTVCAQTYLMARKYFLQSAILEVATQSIVSLVTLAAAYQTRDLRVVIASLVVTRLVSLVIIMAYVHFRLHGFASERYFFGMREQIRYGVVLGLSAMMWTFLMRMHELWVSRYYPIETYAVYAAGCKQIPVMQMFTQSVGPVTLVKFAQLQAAGDWEGIRRFWDKVLGMTWGIGIPVTIFFLVIAEPYVTLMYTQSYHAAVWVYRFAALAALYQLFVPSRVLRAMDRNDISLKVHTGVVVLLPGALYLGMKTGGMYGIIAAHAMMAIFGRVAAQYVTNRIAPIRLRYLPRMADVMVFYRELYAKLQERLAVVGARLGR